MSRHLGLGKTEAILSQAVLSCRSFALVNAIKSRNSTLRIGFKFNSRVCGDYKISKTFGFFILEIWLRAKFLKRLRQTETTYWGKFCKRRIIFRRSRKIKNRNERKFLQRSISGSQISCPPNWWKTRFGAKALLAISGKRFFGKAAQNCV